ncbi:MAG TPA: hypothetical protein VMZ29_03865 [Candidatus Bathyarchaeia archaeon]|nr:hypothetical protein [Candidatus Bathyarchaeia archaeon]
MGKMIKILMSINIILILSLSNLSLVEASSRSWNPGELYTFSSDYTQIVTFQNHDNSAFDKTDLKTIGEITYNVTSINLLNKRYEAIRTDISGAGSIISYRFGMDYYVNNYISLDSILGASYDWDYNHNQTVLSDLDFTLPLWYFIEPDWISFNTKFADALNATEIIATVADPYQPLIHNITFSDFLTSLPTYSIMSKNTLSDAKTRFHNDTTKWFFSFDLSNIVKESIFNLTSLHNDYYPYEQFIFTFELEYEDGGILKNYLVDVSSTITINNITTTVQEYTHIVSGGLKALTANFAYLTIIPALLTIAIGGKLVSNKRRNR